MRISDGIRKAISDSGLSRYKIAQLAAIDESALAKFFNHRRGLSIDAIDRIGELLGLEIKVAAKRTAKSSKRKGS